MRLHHTLLAAAAALALTLPAAAEPAPHQDPAADEARVDAGTIERRIKHLNKAADILTETGLHGEARRLREQAALMRNELRNHQQSLEELRAALEKLRRENQALKQQLSAAPAAAGAPDLDALAARAHNQRTQETWNRIKQAARAPRPAPAAPQDQVIPLHIPRHPAPAVVEVKPRPRPARPDQTALLQNILQTLQRIEEKMGD